MSIIIMFEVFQFIEIQPKIFAMIFNRLGINI